MLLLAVVTMPLLLAPSSMPSILDVLRDVSGLPPPRTIGEARLIHTEFMRRSGAIRQLHGASTPVAAAAVSYTVPTWATATTLALPTAPTSRTRSFCPTDFGGDPSGELDSTVAVLHAVATMLAECAFLNGTARAGTRPMISGVSNCGGATLDLRGGQFLIR